MENSETEWRALMSLLDEFQLSLVQLSELSCCDFEILNKSNGDRYLNFVSRDKNYTLIPYSKVFPVLNHLRTRLRTGNLTARLFPYSPKTIGNRIKELTGKTRRAYLQQIQ